MEKRFKFTGPDGQIDYDMVETDGMEEEMDSMQEQEEPEHTIMYKGVKYVQA